MDKDIRDVYMAMEIVTHSSKQWCIRALCFTIGVFAGAMLRLLLRG